MIVKKNISVEPIKKNSKWGIVNSLITISEATDLLNFSQLSYPFGFTFPINRLRLVQYYSNYYINAETLVGGTPVSLSEKDMQLQVVLTPFNIPTSFGLYIPNGLNAQTLANTIYLNEKNPFIDIEIDWFKKENQTNCDLVINCIPDGNKLAFFNTLTTTTIFIALYFKFLYQ